ncbi:MAG: hypothetical protein M3077_01950 [Candidatus Dormibacteraeota bacterium]|nr:hypothetical protein [Candidatus Dormibacteraeota bacterium]
MHVVGLASAIGFLAMGVLLVVSRGRFVEWVANRNARYGLYYRHDRAARFAAWLMGVLLFGSGSVMLLVATGH